MKYSILLCILFAFTSSFRTFMVSLEPTWATIKDKKYSVYLQCHEDLYQDIIFKKLPKHIQDFWKEIINYRNSAINVVKAPWCSLQFITESFIKTFPKIAFSRLNLFFWLFIKLYASTVLEEIWVYFRSCDLESTNLFSHHLYKCNFI